MRLPGFSSSPPAVPAPAPVVTSEDPEIKKAKDRSRISALRARGRSANIKAPSEDKLGAPSVARPMATSLGGV